MSPVIASYISSITYQHSLINILRAWFFFLCYLITRLYMKRIQFFVLIYNPNTSIHIFSDCGLLQVLIQPFFSYFSILKIHCRKICITWSLISTSVVAAGKFHAKWIKLAFSVLNLIVSISALISCNQGKHLNLICDFLCQNSD